MTRKKTAPTRYYFDFSDSDEEEDAEYEEEEEFVITPPSSSPPAQHHHISAGAVIGAAVNVSPGVVAKHHHAEKMSDNQDETSPIDSVDDQEQENNKSHHANTGIVPGETAQEHHYEEKTSDNQDKISPIDAADNQEQENTTTHPHSNIGAIAGGIACGAVIEGGIIAKKHHDDKQSIDTVDDQEQETKKHHDVKMTTTQEKVTKVVDSESGKVVDHHDQEKKDHHHLDRITKEAREELTVVIKDSKDKAHKRWTANEKANAELEVALIKVQATVLEQVTEVETVVKTTAEVDVINQKLTSATEKANIDTVDDQEQENTKTQPHSNAGAIAGTIACGTAIGGGIIAKKHHESKKKDKAKAEEQDPTSPIDSVDHHDQAKKDPHHGAAIAAGAVAVGAIVAGTTVVEYKHKHDDDKNTEVSKNASDMICSEEMASAIKESKTIYEYESVEVHMVPVQVITDSDKKENTGGFDDLEGKNNVDKADEQVNEEDDDYQRQPELRRQKKPRPLSSSSSLRSLSDTDEQDATSPVDTVDNHVIHNLKSADLPSLLHEEKHNVGNKMDKSNPDEQEKKKSHYFHRHRNHPHHPHLGAIADHVSSAFGAIASGIGIKRHHPHPKPAGSLQSPSPSSTTLASSIITTPGILPEVPHFGIVLVDIKKAAEEHHIHCVKKWLDEDPQYVALSYRWGELDEQIVPATKDYYARIVSFHLDDFFKLCQALHHEPDLQHIQYVWVDAICVDQENMAKRKATIYNMNNIYIQAAAIVAVPDLHAYHISTTTAANMAFMDTIQQYRRYLYYLLVGTPEAQQTLAEMDNAWMDKLGVPTSGSHRRDLILANTTNTTTTTRAMTTTTTKHKSRGITSQLFTQQLMTLMANPRGVAASTVDALKVKEQEDEDQQLSSRMMLEFQRFEWQQQLDQRQTDILQSVQFLQSIMVDWSNRTWVISEYHVAKRKTGKLKFWYNQLSCPELNGQRFFEFEFKKKKVGGRRQQQRQPQALQPQPPILHPYTKQIIDLTSHFDTNMRRRLTKRSLLEMMLQTKASKVEDRFHAIIPLATKYRRYIKNRDSISNLGVTDMLSVRLKLMEWIDVKDRLVLLFSEHRPTSSAFPFMPTYATRFNVIQPDLTKLFTDYKSQCNFDINTKEEEEDDDDDDKDEEEEDDNDSNTLGGDVRLVRTGKLDELWLRPRTYCERQVNPNGKSSFNNLWHDLGIDPTIDLLSAVSIPLFITDDIITDGNTKNDLLTLDLQLLGSWEKNVWIMYPYDASVKEFKTFSMETQRHKLPEGFRVY
ncbi:unnamed protein product [Absidia cylindrospora]